jgi:hypothetical protein
VQLDRVGAEAHRPAEVGDLLLLGQQVDDRERRLGVELGRVGAVHAGDVARELGHGDLHAQADAQVRDLPARGRRARRRSCPRCRGRRSRRDEDAVDALQPLVGVAALELLGVDPVDLDVAPCW